jgi:phosphoglycolate phosphatase
MRDLTIVFDLDGTLVDTAPDLVGATNHALADLGLGPVNAAVLRPYISHGARRMIVEALRHAAHDPGEARVDALLTRFLSHYEANIARESRPFDGAIAALDTLANTGARLAVCTNKREKLSRLLLDALSLSPYFDFVAGRDTFEVCKPHPDHLAGAVRGAGGDPASAVMVGDTIVDMETARAAGVPGIAVTFGYSDLPADSLAADISVNHFNELMGAIETVRARKGARRKL